MTGSPLFYSSNKAEILSKILLTVLLLLALLLASHHMSGWQTGAVLGSLLTMA